MLQFLHPSRLWGFVVQARGTRLRLVGCGKHSHSHYNQAVHPVACISSLRRKRGRPTKVSNAQAVGAGSIADVQPVGQLPGKRRCQVHRPQEEVFFNTSSSPASRDLPSGMVPPATGMEIDAPAGTTAGARRSLRLQGLPPATTGRVRLAGSLPHNTDETSSSEACVLHGLDDVASTPLSEPTSSLHDDGLPFDRGK